MVIPVGSGSGTMTMLTTAEDDGQVLHLERRVYMCLGKSRS
jgi:hypothetical protein